MITSTHAHRSATFATMVFLLYPAFSPAQQSQPAGMSAQRNVVATVLPAYLASVNLTDGVPDVSVRMLLDPALGCPHSYSLTPADRRRLDSATHVVAIGAGMEGFLDKLRRQLTAAKFITLSDSCVLRELPCGHAHDHDHAHAKNPHVWMSPREYLKMIEPLGRQLIDAGDERSKKVAANQAAYAKRIQAVAGEVDELAAKIAGKKVVAGEAVEYLLADLKLDIVTRVPGHEGEGESAAELLAISNDIKKHNAVAIIVESGRRDRIAATLAKEHNITLITLDALTQTDQAIPAVDLYESAMRKNLAVLARDLCPR
ncbi:MAG: zinc ABC transporter substrate-binding protein [Phycisphaerales bacterium]|nr:zinc ABC transporter substrate-binding protein [Phycisphaerales bacterium]